MPESCAELSVGRIGNSEIYAVNYAVIENAERLGPWKEIPPESSTSVAEKLVKANSKEVVEVSWKKVGGPGRDRTDDLFHAMESEMQPEIRFQVVSNRSPARNLPKIRTLSLPITRLKTLF